MLIKGTSRKISKSKLIFPLSLVAIVLLLMAIKFDVISTFEAQRQKIKTYACSAEEVKGDFFIANKVKYLGGITQSADTSYERESIPASSILLIFTVWASSYLI